MNADGLKALFEPFNAVEAGAPRGCGEHEACEGQSREGEIGTQGVFLAPWRRPPDALLLRLARNRTAIQPAAPTLSPM